MIPLCYHSGIISGTAEFLYQNLQKKKLVLMAKTHFIERGF